MTKSGVEYLAQHPGWKTTKKKSKYQAGETDVKPEDIEVILTLQELNDLIDKMDDGLDSGTEYDTLFGVRDTLSEYTSDPDRRIE